MLSIFELTEQSHELILKLHEFLKNSTNQMDIHTQIINRLNRPWCINFCNTVSRSCRSKIPTKKFKRTFGLKWLPGIIPNIIQTHYVFARSSLGNISVQFVDLFRNVHVMVY